MKEDVTCSCNGVFVQFEVVDEGTQQGTGKKILSFYILRCLEVSHAFGSMEPELSYDHGSMVEWTG